MKYLTVDQAAEQTGIPRSTIVYNIRQEHLPAIRFGDGIKAPYAIAPDDLDAWVARRQGRNRTPQREGLTSLGDAADRLGLTRQGLYWKIQEGHIQAERRGRYWYLTEATIQTELGSN
jgi:excisionase family DNA binding protein